MWGHCGRVNSGGWHYGNMGGVTLWGVALLGVEYGGWHYGGALWGEVDTVGVELWGDTMGE